MSETGGLPRYLLGALEDRGVMLGLGWNDLTVLGGAGVVVVLAILVVPILVALVVGVVVCLVAVAAVFWRIDGWRGHEYLRLWRRYTKAQTTRAGGGIPSEFDGLSVLAVDAGTGSPVGVIHDERAGTWTAVIATGSTNVALVDEDERARYLAKWAAILDQVSYSGSVLYRLAWVASVSPDPGDKIANWFLIH
ncbi:integral membrane protein, partial [mine drainage metagenome]